MIGKRLKELRKDKGWLQQEIAERLGISVKHYSQLERNRAQPSMGLLQKVAELFKVKVPELYEEVTAGEPDQEKYRFRSIYKKNQ